MLLWTLLAPQQWVPGHADSVDSRNGWLFQHRRSMLWHAMAIYGDFPSVVHDMRMTLNYLHKDRRRHDCQAHQVMHARLYTKASWQEAGNLMISTVPWLRRCFRTAQGSLCHDS